MDVDAVKFTYESPHDRRCLKWRGRVGEHGKPHTVWYLHTQAFGQNTECSCAHWMLLDAIS